MEEMLYPKFSNEEYERRYQKVREAMISRGLDCLVVYGGHKEHFQCNVRYLSNFTDLTQCYVVFPLNGDPSLLSEFKPAMQTAKSISVIKDTEWGGVSIADSVCDKIKKLGLETGNIGIVGIDSWRKISIPVEHYKILERRLPQARLTIASEIFDEIRLIKSLEEIEFLEKGAELTDVAIEALVKAVKPGVTEHDLRAAAAFAYLRLGGSLTIQLLGSTSMKNPDPRAIHGTYPSNRKIKSGDIITTEISVDYGGYSGQIVRTIAVGEPTKVYRDLSDVALETYNRISNVLKPGSTEKDIMKAAKPILDAGLVTVAPLIHGWSMKFEQPIIGLPSAEEWQTRPVEFKEGMSIVIEPNPSTADLKKGFFIGNLNLITKNGVRSLQRYPLEFIDV